MRIGIMVGVVAAGMLMGGTALADGDVPSGIEVGLRTGYGLALGSAAGGNPGQNMSDYIGGEIPIWIDAGYRLANPNLFLGAYFQYGIGFTSGQTSTACSQSGVSCSANILMYGIQAHYHFMPDNQFDPYAGLGIGLENANLNVSAGGQSAGSGASGWDFAILQAGADYRGLMDGLGLGAFINFGLGQYNSASQTVGGQSQSASIQNQAMHEWLMFGIRGVYDIKI
jgi:opacity protein-like surface antigen